MKRILLRYGIAIIVALNLVSCIDEDLSNCTNVVGVMFDYDTSITPPEVHKMNLYVFDSQGILRCVIEDNNPQLSPNYLITLPELPVGNYRIVAWGNLYGCFSTEPATFVVGETTFDEAHLVFEHSDVAAIVEQPLFFADLESAAITTKRDQRFRLPMEQITNRITLTVEGLPVNNDVYRFSITDNNGLYGFDDTFDDDTTFRYETICNKDEQGEPTASLTVLQLDEYRHPILELYDVTTQTVIYRADLVALLNARGVDYHTQHDFDIHLIFDTSANVEVIINGWQVAEDGFDL